MDNNLLQPQPLEDVLADHQADLKAAKEAEEEVTQVVLTPAWAKVKEKLQDRIDAYRRGDALRDLLRNGDVANERIGELWRVQNLVADDLNSILADVIETVKAHEK